MLKRREAKNQDIHFKLEETRKEKNRKKKIVMISLLTHLLQMRSQGRTGYCIVNEQQMENNL